MYRNLRVEWLKAVQILANLKTLELDVSFDREVRRHGLSDSISSEAVVLRQLNSEWQGKKNGGTQQCTLGSTPQ
jgi:hypothetical protein